jgi:hypothetical protein
VGAAPGGGADRDVTAADGTQAECIEAGWVQLDWHTHDADAAAVLLLPVSPGPPVILGAGAMSLWDVVPACREWATGWDAGLCAVREDAPEGSVEEAAACMA